MEKKYIETGLWLYDSTAEDYKGTDYSDKVLAGDQYTEDLTDEIDTANITICGLETAVEFAPETKFIYEKTQVTEYYTDGELVDRERTVEQHHDLVVEQDTVAKTILSDDGYFDHHIAFCEPSVVAQKRVVDNLATTYKLQDVSLTERKPIEVKQKSITNKNETKYVPERDFGDSVLLGFLHSCVYGKYFTFENGAIGEDSTTTQELYYYSVPESGKATFKIPRIIIHRSVDGTKEYGDNNGYASTDYIIKEYSLNGVLLNDNYASGTIKASYNDASFLPNDETYILESVRETIPNGWLIENVYGRGVPEIEVKQYAEQTASSQYIELDVNVDRKYVVTVSLHNYTNELSNNRVKRSQEEPSGVHYYSTPLGSEGQWQNGTTQRIDGLTATCEFVTYSEGTPQVIYQSANPYSAWQLLQKAILCTGTIEKPSGTKVYDTKTAFYIDENYIDRLRDTEVVENFYNEKNLWEICLDVGKYIHAVPEIVFGTDDRFKITFNELGVADESENKETTLSVLNFKNVEDYISACSSYITNMVQLDGINDEVIVPKTTSEDFAITNDDSCLKTSKKIIEIVSLTVTNRTELTLDGDNGETIIHAGEERTLTSRPQPYTSSQLLANPYWATNPSGFVFEDNVYKTLDNSYVNVPNKGISMYYTLGTDTIRGWDFRSTTKNSGDRQNDYAIKKILYYAYYGSIPSTTGGTAYWRGIKVNDFVFHIIYRTKDSLRQEQSRPDLRKYLLNSKYDRVPTHQQFNNQEDTLIDSVKFGNNIYGKLIRTGNTNYKYVEWCESLSECKHKGELYRINETDDTFDETNGNLYYVAQVQHVFYGDYIVSTITYSKDYNKLSQIIGIPSEPRFYEISEQSSIPREFVINDYLVLNEVDNDREYDEDKTFLTQDGIDAIGSLILANTTSAGYGRYPHYAVLTFKNDSDSIGDPYQGSEQFSKNVMLPLSTYSCENTLTLECDCVDNFSAGDKVVDISATDQPEEVDKAYKSLTPVRYTDVFGRAQLLDFYILPTDTTLTAEQAQSLPEVDDETDWQESVLATNNKDGETTEDKGLVLLKDNREIISTNYNVQLLTASDTFVLSPFVFKEKNTTPKMVLLNREVNKLSSGYIDNFANAVILPYDEDGVQFDSPYLDFSTDVAENKFSANMFAENFINWGHFNGDSDYAQAKAVAIVYDIADDSPERIPSKAKFICARNLPSSWTVQRKMKDWEFSILPKGFFANKQ